MFVVLVDLTVLGFDCDPGSEPRREEALVLSLLALECFVVLSFAAAGVLVVAHFFAFTISVQLA